MGLVLASLLKIFEGWSAAVLAVVGAGSLFAAAITIVQSRRDAKTARTFEYMRRLYGLEFGPLNTRVLLFLQTGDEGVFWPKAKAPSPSSEEPSPETKWATYKCLDLECQAKITLVLNFYEELSGSYLAKLLDNKVADNMLIPVAVAAWEPAKWLIFYQRNGIRTKYKNDELAEEIMEEWQRLVEGQNAGPPPAQTRPWDRLRHSRWGFSTFLISLAGVLAVSGLAAVAAGADGFQDTAASFLFAAAAVCLVLVTLALALLLAPSRLRRALIVSATLTATLSIGLTATLALSSSRGPRGHVGKQGDAGKRGPPGRRGLEGKRGKRGPEGKQGPRGYPGHLDS